MRRDKEKGIILAVLIFLAGMQAFAQSVIMLIPDGMSVAGTTLARFYKGEPLALDAIACGLVSTWNSDGTIADSAPAGSAYATGWASQTGNIASIGKSYVLPGVEIPEYEAQRPVATILEAARLSGRSTGIISTSEFMHATPADFSAHDVSRSNYDNLAEQIVYNNIDVVLGGIYEPAEAPAIRQTVSLYLGIANLTDEEVEAIGKTKAGSMNYTVGPMVGSRAKIGYTTNGHTGEDVVLYCYDPFGQRMTGLVRNTDIALYMARTMNVDLAQATSELFQDANSMFAKKVAKVATDTTDPENAVLVVTKGDQVLRVPRNKSYAYLNGRAVTSDGVAVYNGTKWYIARNLLDLIE